VSNWHVQAKSENSVKMISDFNPETDIIPTLAQALISKKSIDVGANRGEFTAALRQAGFEVDCFEPLPSLVKDLVSRFAGDAGVRIHEIACSNRDGLSNLYEFSATDSNLDSTLFSTLKLHPTYDGLSSDQHSRVQTNRLDTFFSEVKELPIGILKIDTEGHDIAVFQGATKIKPEALLFEFWDSEYVFNRGQVANRLFDYELVIAKDKFPFNILFWRKSDTNSFGIVCNATVSPRKSWGNILYLNSSSAYVAVRKFCLIKYGSERLADIMLAEPMFEQSESKLPQSNTD
jgi:FkbM family methyltransferase